MARRPLSSIAAVSCALLFGCSDAEQSTENPTQITPAAGSSSGQAGSGSAGRASSAGSAAAGGAGAGNAAGQSAGAAGRAAVAGASAGQPAAPAAGGGASAPDAGTDPGGATAPLERAMIAADTAPAVSESDYASFIDHLNQFGLELGQKQAAANDFTTKNLVYSPLSASYALGMTYAGARGTTADEMKKVLGDSFAAGVFHKSANRLARELASRVTVNMDRKIELSLADALFVENTFALEPAFLETMARDYDTGVFREDFIRAFEPARMHINTWVAKQTRDRIQDLLPMGSLDESTRLVLVNALYFYGSWAIPFKANSTSDAPFHTLAGATTQVKTMHGELAVPYATAPDYAVAELPYEGRKLRMTLVLPAAGKFESVRSQLSAAWLRTATASLGTKTLNVALPKWKVTAGSFSLKPALEELGMKTAFTDAADLSGLSKAGSLKIDDVVQKAFIAVDELGTEAAAATGVTVGLTSAPLEVIPFIVDRPFLYFIRDDNGSVLFSGHIVDPSQMSQ